MDRDRWVKFVTEELTKLAPDKQAMRGWIKRQGFRIESEGGYLTGAWWFSAENPQMAFTKLTIRWDPHIAPSLSVEVG